MVIVVGVLEVYYGPFSILGVRLSLKGQRPTLCSLQSQSQEEKEVEVGVGVDCGADGRVRHITWSLMLMYAQWAQNQWCISVSAGSFFPPRWSGREKKGQAHPPHLSSKTTGPRASTRKTLYCGCFVGRLAMERWEVFKHYNCADLLLISHW